MTAEAGRAMMTRGVRRGAYLLPSLFTIGNILLGFYAVILGLRSAGLIPHDPSLGEPRSGFGLAALLVFVAGILDALDGRIARLIGTESDFGKEYDSLADVFTFGAVPALLTYLWGLYEWGRPGWLVPFFYLVCTATRLARFNVQTRVVDARYFVGLPAPAAAGAICSILYFDPNSYFAPDSAWKTWMQLLVLVSLVLIGALMVSTFRYHSFKKIDPRQRWSYRTFVPLASVILVIAWKPRAVFLAIAVLFTLSGPVSFAINKWRSRPRRPKTPMPPPEPGGGESAAPS
ncbi:MAG TPA: CDP-diacylglycerol--serine O-phosphatidyltransferase [Thermoanaerobaculia bacterium]|nr:CDP-diacylglycerol--serine O-phosphatidyltransferase [Thermoanaerobaculia bacterium]